MEKSLFSFIWAHSKREQLVLLFVTLLTFPLLFATLDLPKRIINDAIGSTSSVIELVGFEMTQIQFLMLLCGAFLLSVILHGIVKMRLNTMKGVLAERMLRRFRFNLISRMHRFPRSYFRKTSQGELVSMITSEAEPMGGADGGCHQPAGISGGADADDPDLSVFAKLLVRAGINCVDPVTGMVDPAFAAPHQPAE